MKNQQRQLENAMLQQQSDNVSEIDKIQNNMADMTNNLIGGVTGEMQQL